VIRTTRQAVLAQIAQHRPRKDLPLRVLIDLTSLEKCGKFLHLSTPTADPETFDPWVRMLNSKRGLHLVVLYLVLGQWRVPWSFRVWRGKGHPSPVHLACKLLATVPSALTQGAPVIVLADTEFGTIEFLNACAAVPGEPWWACAAIVSCKMGGPSNRSIAQAIGATGADRWHGLSPHRLLVLAQTSRGQAGTALCGLDSSLLRRLLGAIGT